MGQSDGELKTLTIDDNIYLVPVAVFELLMIISKERDNFAKALYAMQQKKGE